MITSWSGDATGTTRPQPAASTGGCKQHLASLLRTLASRMPCALRSCSRLQPITSSTHQAMPYNHHPKHSAW